jgi:hypothetical protein
MATQYATMSDVQLSALELDDVRDRRRTKAQPDHMFRWVIAIVAVLAVSHFVFNPAEMAQPPQGGITFPTSP